MHQNRNLITTARQEGGADEANKRVDVARTPPDSTPKGTCLLLTRSGMQKGAGPRNEGLTVAGL